MGGGRPCPRPPPLSAAPGAGPTCSCLRVVVWSCGVRRTPPEEVLSMHKPAVHGGDGSRRGAEAGRSSGARARRAPRLRITGVWDRLPAVSAGSRERQLELLNRMAISEPGTAVPVPRPGSLFRPGSGTPIFFPFSVLLQRSTVLRAQNGRGAARRRLTGPPEPDTGRGDRVAPPGTSSPGPGGSFSVSREPDLRAGPKGATRVVPLLRALSFPAALSARLCGRGGAGDRFRQIRTAARRPVRAVPAPRGPGGGNPH